MRNRLLLVALSACSLVLPGCAKAEVPEEEPERAAVPVPGTDRVQVHLTPEAVRRLDLQTGTVRDEAVPPRPTIPPAAAAPVAAAAPAAPAAAEVDAAKGAKRAAPVVAPPPPTAPPAPPVPTVRRVIPIGAVLYAASGESFTYVSVAPEVYERTPITVEYATGELAVLSAGPPPGTVVVTVGGPELSGAEFGVGE